jgi:hypothetical protein
MDVKAHFTSLTRELEALRDRVRNFSVDTPHWPTDGEWKESVLRAFLRGCLPSHIEPLRGFVVTPRRGTKQIDLLLYDNRQPVLFRDGDLVFVTPDAVLGIVEVKSNIRNRGDLREALASLADNAELIRTSKRRNDHLFVGLFSYTTHIRETGWRGVLDDLQDVARGRPHRIVSYVCLGCSHFSKFWDASPDDPAALAYNTWHSYELPNLAAGYFINNIVATVAGESVATNQAVWFPAAGKEFRRLGGKQFTPHNQRLHPTAARTDAARPRVSASR